MDDTFHSENVNLQDGTNSHPPIRVCGARTHNLKNVSVEFPWNQTTVVAGPSGGGKSSLVFDTLFAEGQRQYVESLPLGSRRFLNTLARPDLDFVSGLQPTVGLKQIPAEPNPRATVATVAEIYDFLCLLYARGGVPHCYRCGRVIQRQTVEQMAQIILALPKNTRFILLAPVAREQLGSQKEVIDFLIKRGKSRARIDGSLVELSKAPALDPKEKHSIDAVIDRLFVRDGIESRLLESLNLALSEGSGNVCCLYEKERLQTENGGTKSVWKELLFSSRFSCPKCGLSYDELEPRTFNYDSSYGSCPRCGGLGKLETFDPVLLFPEPAKNLENGLALEKGLATSSRRELNALLESFKHLEPVAFQIPMSEWDEKVKKVFLYGLPRENSGFISPNPDDRNDQSRKKSKDISFNPVAEMTPEVSTTSEAIEKHGKLDRNVDRDKATPLSESAYDTETKIKNNELSNFDGLIATLERIYINSKSAREKEYLETFRNVIPCNECDGSRLRLEARAVTVGGKKINETTSLSVSTAIKWFETLKFDELRSKIVAPIVEQILERLKVMASLRLEYLSLDRPADTLSGGELQRVRLTTALGNNLSGICYILDEPTTGLHPRDIECLLRTLDSLKERGNTIILVEHNEVVVRQADWLIDVGPRAGVAGGEILATGTPSDVSKEKCSPTGLFLSGRASIKIPTRRRKFIKTRSLTIDGIRTNNLKNVTLMLPLELLVCVSGVSGSGKSSLINKTLVPAIQRRLRNVNGIQSPIQNSERNFKFKSMRGASRIDKLVEVTQDPIGRSPRSNPATYSGVFDEIRKIFAESREAKTLGFKAGRFSFNVAGGRCEECQGIGAVKVDNPFLPNAYATCPVCGGKRFNSQTLQVHYKNKTIADTLNMSFDEAATFFENQSSLMRYIESFQRVGLGYLKLGQSSTSLSGGEAQRVKLATEFAKTDTGHTLYVLDEPTSGLHPIDVQKLLDILQSLVDKGNTVVVIEHSLDVMKSADWIIDLGPDGGENGGEIIATGTPEEIAVMEGNETGRALRSALGVC